MYESNAISGQHSAGNYGTSKLEQSTVGMNGAIEAARVWRPKKDGWAPLFREKGQHSLRRARFRGDMYYNDGAYEVMVGCD